MPDEVIGKLPPTIMVSAKLDILYPSQVLFKNRLQAQGVEVDWMDFDGLHQVKDMDQVTEAGRIVRQRVTEKSIAFAKRERRSATSGAMPPLNHQNAMAGLGAMASAEMEFEKRQIT